MKFINSIGDIFRRGTDGVTSLYSGFKSMFVREPSDEQLRNASFNATVYTCINLISQYIEHFQFHIKDKKVAYSLENPNIYQTKNEFLKSIASDMLVFGNAYSLKLKGSKSYTLAPLDASKVIPEGNMANPSYRMKDTGEVYNGDEIIHFRYGIGNTLKATGKLAAIYNRVMILDEADRDIERTFRGGVRTNYIVQTKSTDRELVKEVTKKIMGSITSDDPTKLVVLSNGMEMQAVPGVKPADSDLRELRSDIIREIAGIYGLPPFAVGGDSDTKYSNTVARHQQINSAAVVPLIKTIAAKLAQTFETEITYDIENVIDSDFQQRLDLSIHAAGGAVMSPDESRARYLGMGPIEGGAELRAGWTETTDDPNTGDDDELPADGSESDKKK